MNVQGQWVNVLCLVNLGVEISISSQFKKYLNNSNLCGTAQIIPLGKVPHHSLDSNINIKRKPGKVK